MGTLKDTILSDANKPTVIKDCALLVDAEVASKKGMTGMMIKSSYKMFKAIKPTIVEQAVGVLLDDFAQKLDEQYDAYLSAVPDKSQAFDQWATARDKEIADQLLGVTDNIINRSDKNAIKKIYSGLRGIAEKNVAAAVPAVGKLVMKYAG
ncbi:MAG: hypothetical protein JXX29_20785 [Deltaproteobacteria bacterium]|nr:hypothetical protein [Deltaproteobacteria bacterium]MBN2674130.1 hypothetical protein [Deltaproteobacteria bacterium]